MSCRRWGWALSRCMKRWISPRRPGRALAGMLAVFAEFEREILRERVKAGIAQARKRGQRHGRLPTVVHCAEEVRHLSATGLSKSAIARRSGISRTSVRRFLG
jgi:putative DNA-invertase from lambdoid prophage Rac